MPRNFSALNNYAQREYKFSQRASYRLVGQHYPAFPSGVCMGITMNWVREKLTTSNGLFRSDGLLWNSTSREFSRPLDPVTRLRQGISPSERHPMGGLIAKGKSGPRNEQAMLHGAGSHAIYAQENQLSTLINHLQIVESGYIAYERTTRGPAPDFIPETNHAETIADAARDLPKGNALLIELSPSTRDGLGHTIAFYRSRGNHLYFFDPNAGVYKISPSKSSNTLDFVRAWLDAYATSVDPTPITWEIANHRWYSSFRRPHTRP